MPPISSSAPHFVCSGDGTIRGSGAESPAAGGLGVLGRSPQKLGNFLEKTSCFNAIGSHFVRVHSSVVELESKVFTGSLSRKQDFA